MNLPDRLRIKGKRMQCEHVSDRGRRCRHMATSVDHITPQAIARRLKWTDEETHSPENTQRLCERHHKAKDNDTALRVAVLKAQQRGELHVGLGQHEQAMQKVALYRSVQDHMRSTSRRMAREEKRREKRRGNMQRAS